MPVKLCGSVRCCTNSWAQEHLNSGSELPMESLILHRTTLDDTLRRAYAREFKQRDKRQEVILVAPITHTSLTGEVGKEARRYFGLFVLPLPEEGTGRNDSED